MLIHLLLFFAKTPVPDADTEGQPAVAAAGEADSPPEKDGTISEDDVRISKKEYQDLLSAKGLLSSFHSRRDKEHNEMQEQVDYWKAEAERLTQPPKQPSELETLLAAEPSETDEYSDNGAVLIKQLVGALQADMDSKLTARDEQIQLLISELDKTKQENELATRTIQRQAKIDNALNDRATKLAEEYHISHQDALDFLSDGEKIIDTFNKRAETADNEIGNLYGSILDIVGDMVKKQTHLNDHKSKVEADKTAFDSRIAALNEGDAKPVVVNLRERPELPEGLPAKREGESWEDYSYRAARERFNKLQAAKQQGSTANFR